MHLFGLGRYSRYIRYSLFFITLFLMIGTIQVYMNNFNIETDINETKSQITDFKNNTAFKKNFYMNYLSGEYSVFFVSHEKNILFRGERIIKLNDLSNEKDLVGTQIQNLDAIRQKNEVLNITDPKAARLYFLNSKIDKIR